MDKISQLMTEDIVTLNLAKKLKEKGFSEPVGGRYFKNKYHRNTLGNLYNHNGGEISKNYISAPTHGLVKKWLRILYKFQINIIYEPYLDETGFDFYFVIFDYNTKTVVDGKYIAIHWFKTYEEAVEGGINFVLDNLNVKL